MTILGSGPDDIKTRVLEAAAALIAGLCRFHAHLTIDVFDPGMWDADGTFDGTRSDPKSLLFFQGTVLLYRSQLCYGGFPRSSPPQPQPQPPTQSRAAATPQQDEYRSQFCYISR